MPFDIPYVTVDRLAAFLLVFMRMTGLIVAAPLFSGAFVPMQVRVWVSVLLAGVCFPLACQLSPEGIFTGLFRHPLTAVVAVAGELAIGWTIGWIASLVLRAAEVAGHLISQELGFTLADVYDPATDITGSPLTQLFFLLALVVFVTLGGHQLAVAALAKSFQVAPPGTFPCGEATGMFLAKDIGLEVWTLGFNIAIPVILVMFLVTVALALLSRAVPEINIFAVGLGVRVLLGLFATIAVLPFATDVLREIAGGMNGHFTELASTWSGG